MTQTNVPQPVDCFFPLFQVFMLILANCLLASYLQGRWQCLFYSSNSQQESVRAYLTKMLHHTEIARNGQSNYKLSPPLETRRSPHGDYLQLATVQSQNSCKNPQIDLKTSISVLWKGIAKHPVVLIDD